MFHLRIFLFEHILKRIDRGMHATHTEKREKR